jgi:chaperone modulatory protein CbpM
MMIELEALCVTIGRAPAEVRGWIAAGWVMPTELTEPPRFAEADAARVRLIAELRYELQIEEDDLALVLSLLDQVYGLRRQLNALATAVSRQPDEVRRAIAAAMEG